MAFHKYTVIKWWSEDDFFSRSTICLWKVVFIYHFILESTGYFIRSRQCLPFYFGEHFIFMRRFQCLLFYFGEHCIFWKVVNVYHFILGSTVYIYCCLHLPFYHERSRWRKNYNSFYNPNRPWLKTPSPPPRHFGLFSYPFSTHFT